MSRASQAAVELWIRDYPELQFNGRELYCSSCNTTISWTSKTNFNRHISSQKHMCASGSTDSDSQRNFNLDLVEMMVGCNIPWSKLDNPLFRQFLEKCISGKYNNVQVPSETYLHAHTPR